MTARNCSTCEHAGSDGDYGTIKTCDAPGDDAQQAQIDAWVQAGESGDCPLHALAWWADPAALADWERQRLEQCSADLGALTDQPEDP